MLPNQILDDRQSADGPSRRCLVRLLIDAWRLAAERDAEAQHLAAAYAFIADLCTAQAHEIDQLHRQRDALRDENRRLRGPIGRAA